MSSSDKFDIRPLSPALGAEIIGIDLNRDIDDDAFSSLRDALGAYGVIFFRDQDLTPEAQIAFAERWAPININRFFKPVEDYPMIAEVRKEPDQKRNIGSIWHTDHSYDEAPSMGSVLLAREVPEVGGDTLFSSTALAYETLSEGLKETLSGLNAWHSSRHAFGHGGTTAELQREGRIQNPDLATQDACHPVVISHPQTGRKTLFVNPGFTRHFDGWTEAESKPLLDFLYAHASRPEFTCRFSWRVGSMAVWDNRATWHFSMNDYTGVRRLMHRITLEGERLQ